MPKYFMDLKKCWGGYAKICYGLEKNVWEVCQQILGMDLKKKIGGGGYAQIFHRLEKCWGGGYANKFYGLEKNVGGGGLCPNILCI